LAALAPAARTIWLLGATVMLVARKMNIAAGSPWASRIRVDETVKAPVVLV
jgi:hypothetical protein